MIPAEHPSGSNCQVCSNHPRRGPRGPRGSLTKLSLRTPGPSERPGASRKPACHSSIYCQQRCCLCICILSTHASFPPETHAHQTPAIMFCLYFSDSAVNVCYFSCVCDLHVKYRRGMQLLCVPCSIPPWLDSSVPMRGPQGPLVS